MAKRGEIVGAVDFGSRDVRVLIAQKGDDGAIQVIGHGVAPAKGCVMQGVIQDLSASQRALKQALSAAEKEAGVKVPTLFCGVNGCSVDTHIKEGKAILDKETVDLSHMDEALEQASRNIIAPGKKVCSSITSQEWYVDDLRVSDPTGIRGSVLKTRVHFALLPSVIEDNITSAIESQGRELEDVVYLPLASALGCLTPEDMELGVCVLDLGRTTCGLAMYRERRIVTTHSFEWGGFHITRDVAAGLQVSFEEAVDLIQEYGISDALIRTIDEEHAAGGNGELPPSGKDGEERSAHIKLKSVVRGAPSIVDRAELDDIVFLRSKELMESVRRFLKQKGYLNNLVRGIVLVGGAANIQNMPGLAEAVFLTPARVGAPEGIDILPPQINASEFVAPIGILQHGFQYRDAIRSGRIETQRGPVGAMVASVGGFVGKYFF